MMWLYPVFHWWAMVHESIKLLRPALRVEPGTGLFHWTKVTACVAHLGMHLCLCFVASENRLTLDIKTCFSFSCSYYLFFLLCFLCFTILVNALRIALKTSHYVATCYKQSQISTKIYWWPKLDLLLSLPISTPLHNQVFISAIVHCFEHSAMSQE